MKRPLRVVLFSLPIALYVIAVVACDDRGAACKIDTDCPTGDICREGFCGSPRPDGGVFDADITNEAGAICSSDGVICTLSTECCSGQCTENKCGLTPGSTTMDCKNLFESCITTPDCCSGLSCLRNLCRTQ